MRAEARKYYWDMFDNVQTEGDLDEATTRHEVINKVIGKPIKLNWMTQGLQQEIWDRNYKRELLKRKGKNATAKKWKNWTRQRREIKKDVRNATS